MLTSISRIVVAILVATAVCSSSRAADSGDPKFALLNPYNAYLKLDGRWYGVTSNRVWEIDLVGMSVFVDDTTATNCRRANGAFPSLGGGWIFGVGSPMSFIGARTSGDPVRAEKSHPDVPAVIELASLDGDIQCGGQVSAPVLIPPAETPIFVSGFE